MTLALELLNGLRKETKLVLDIILKKGCVTKADIQDVTKMKLSTLNRVMQPLEDRGFILQSSIGESTGGRKPVLYDINPRGYYLIGVDISRTYTRMIVANMKMEALCQKRFDMLKSSTPEEVVHIISDFVRNSCEHLKIKEDRIIGIGVGTVGPLDRKKGIVLNPVNFLSDGWHNVPVKKMLEEATGLPVIIDNGANMAALAEYIYGEGKGSGNLAYINCGIGIRTGVISSGTVVRTIDDTEDAFGHMVVDADGELCSCGNYGCIECYSSIPAIVEKFIRELKKGRVTTAGKIPEDINDINYIRICEAAENGDDLAKETIVGSAAVFGVGLANYINLLGPRVVVLSGPLIEHSKLFFDTCTEIALKKCFSGVRSRIRFTRFGFFRDNAIAVGAAASLLEEALKQNNEQC